MTETDIDEKPRNKISRYTMKARRSKAEAKPITITVERLSDKSRITFTISSDKTIEQLRALLNHHLPPLSPDRFDLYSYQRGALIHFHPSSFKLDYFPVIFDQSVLFLKMDDQLSTSELHPSPPMTRKRSKKTKFSLLNHFLTAKSSSPPISRKSSEPSQPSPSLTSSPSPSSSSTSSITCLSLFKQIFHQSSSKPANKCGETNVLSY